MQGDTSRSRSRRIAMGAVPLLVVGAVAGATVDHLGSSRGGATAATAAQGTAASRSIALTGSSTELTPAEIYAADSPGVVDIQVSGTSSTASSQGDGQDPYGFGFGGQGQGQGQGQGSQTTSAEGSGFVLDTKGDIVTNQHVVDGASSITVTFNDGTKAKATLVGSDTSSDLAVIRVSVDASKLHPLDLGSDANVAPGDAVAAIGSPFGYSKSITAGIVSALARQIQAPNGATITGAIQTDAAINPGNSGGPLIDTSGHVIGVNAQIKSSTDGNEGVGFAIPIDTVKKVSSALIGGQTISHPYLGVQLSDAASGSGAQVQSVQAGSAAATAGIQAGDVITAVGGTAVTSADDLATAIAAQTAGQTITVTVSRGGSEQQLSVTLGTRSQ